VGQYRLPGHPMTERHGFLRTSDGTFITIDPPDALVTHVLGINRRGEIVGRFCTVLPCSPDKRHGFLLRGAAFTTIDFPGAAGTNAWGINIRGEIVGGYQGTDGKSHVFRLREGQFKTIDFPGAFDTAPDGTKGGINSRGDIVSYYCVAAPCDDSQRHGFLQSGGEFTTTMDFPATTMGSLVGHVAADLGINARGDIVGYYCVIAPCEDNQHGLLLKHEDGDEDED
jgi:hypothetical protein